MRETPPQPVLHEIEFRLSYGDCDPAGIVYFAAYYPWFERTYNEWAFLGGFPPGKMVELWGATHVSVASSCRYRIPGRLHDPLTCRMRLGRLGNTSFAVHLSVDTVFNAGTTNTIDVGTQGTPTQFISAAAGGSAVVSEAAITTKGKAAAAAADTVVGIRYNYTGGAPTTGSCEVMIEFEGGFASTPGANLSG